MDDDTYQHLMRRIAVFRGALVMPGRLVGFEEQSERHATGNGLYRITWDCPRCDTRNVFSNVLALWGYQMSFFTFSCRSCRSRFDIENLVSRGHDDAETNRRYEHAARLRAAGDLSGAISLFGEICAANDGTDSMARAAFDLGNIFMDETGQVEHAVNYLGLAAELRPFNIGFPRREVYD